MCAAACVCEDDQDTDGLSEYFPALTAAMLTVVEGLRECTSSGPASVFSSEVDAAALAVQALTLDL